MTEPTPPPAGEPTPGAAPPPGQSFGQPGTGAAGARPTFSMADVRSRAPMDLAAVIIGGIFFILSFVFPYYGASAQAFGVSESASFNAWHSWDFLAMLLLLVATVLFAVRVFAGESLPESAIGYRWIAAGIAALGLVIFIIRTFTLPHGNAGLGVSYGVRWGGWVDLILYVAFVVVAVLAAREGDGPSPMPNRSTTA